MVYLLSVILMGSKPIRCTEYLDSRFDEARDHREMLCIQ